jgi:hypothetical protein
VPVVGGVAVEVLDVAPRFPGARLDVVVIT